MTAVLDEDRSGDAQGIRGLFFRCRRSQGEKLSSPPLFRNEMFLLRESVIPPLQMGLVKKKKRDNLQVSFAKSPPVRSWNVIRQKRD